eukprot:Rmarinus@m.25921
MVVYNFKKIQTVPSAKDFVDIVLSMTQRKTPTVVHKGYKITRIRQFYMRKVKFTQTNYNEKISKILEDFPRLDDIHPFYADLLNVLYDRDHYKLALASLNKGRNLIDQICKHYVKMLKYGDSLYRCKTLKRAALGRMCTVMKKQGPSLTYLDEVRQHLARLPSIDPNTRTLLVCGYPNVGKSSFMNKITRANVEVQPYAFTTKSLFVGHTDFEYLRWQVIDTPGILDHPLEERNTIEMQSVTALAHLRAAVLYFFDISEQCGYTLKQQAGLFHSIRPLFANKPLIVVANKTDVKKYEDLSPEDKGLFEECLTSPIPGGDKAHLICMSNVSEEGISKVKETACKLLLEQRVAAKTQTRKVDDVMNKLEVTLPKPRDSKKRPVCIPDSVMARRRTQAETDGMDDVPVDDHGGAGPTGADVLRRNKSKRLLRDAELEGGGPGVFNLDLRMFYDLKDEEWRHDVIPEIMDGKNVMDFWDDADIEARLDALEKEEDERLAELAESDDDEADLLTEAQRADLAAIRKKKGLMKLEQEVKKGSNKARVSRRATGGGTTKEFEEHLRSMGVTAEDAEYMVEGVRSRARSRSRGRDAARTRSQSRAASEETERGRKRQRSVTRDVSVSRSRDRSAFRNEKERERAHSLARDSHKERNKRARKGEADRHIPNLKPKHLFSGKSGVGSRTHR